MLYAFSSVCHVFTSSNLPPCLFCSDFPLRPCDRFEFIGLAGHFTGDWAQTPSHSSRQLPMYTNVIFCCTGWSGPLQWVITIIYNPHVGMQLSMAMMPLKKHVVRFMWRVSQRKLPAVTRVQTKTKKQKNKHDLSQPLVEMYSIALPTGRPAIYNRIHSKVAWTTQGKCDFGGTVFDGLATTKDSKPNRFWQKNTDLVWHFITRVCVK